MGKKESFAKLAEELDKLEKSEPEVKVPEAVAPIVEPEVVQPEAEKPVVEEPKAEEPKAEEPKAEEPKDEEPVAKSAEPEAEPEEVEKSKKDDCEDDCKDDKDDKPKKDDKKKKKEDKEEDKDKDKEPVKKSESSDDSEPVSEQDFLGAFEAVIKSYSGLKSELAEIKKSLADVIAMIPQPAVEELVAKSAEPADEPVEEPVVEEPVAKSVEPEEDSEGKAVEYVSKSNGVPELPADEEPPAEEPTVEFNPLDHVKQVTEYFMKNGTSLNQGQKAAFRAAVGRVKRGEGTPDDVNLFKEVAETYEN